MRSTPTAPKLPNSNASSPARAPLQRYPESPAHCWTSPAAPQMRDVPDLPGTVLCGMSARRRHGPCTTSSYSATPTEMVGTTEQDRSR